MQLRPVNAGHYLVSLIVVFKEIAGVSREDLLHFFQAVVRPILEYAWHTSLTKEQSTSLENIQRRALQITVGNVSYEVACDKLNLSTF